MTREVVTTSPQAPLHEVAALMERNAVRRLPVLENDQLVGIVSRANLLQAVASARQLLDIAPSDKAIRDRILSSLQKEALQPPRPHADRFQALGSRGAQPVHDHQVFA
jgi:CBS domain-containing protein